MPEIQESTERRLFERFIARFPAKIKDGRGHFGSRIVLRDASAQGARFASKDHFYLKDSLSLQVDLPDGMSPMNMRGQVKWTKERGHNEWDVGLKFHEISLMHMSRLYKFAAEPLFASHHIA